MKLLWAVPTLFLCLILIGCDRGDSIRDEEMLAPLGTEVLQNVFDDQQSTVYIRVNVQLDQSANEAIANIITKKEMWEQKFPSKKVVAMSVVTGSFGGYGHPKVVGLLIHYESVPLQTSTTDRQDDTTKAQEVRSLMKSIQNMSDQELLELTNQSRRTP